MFKFRSYRSHDNPKIKWLIVEYRDACREYSRCPYGHTCKYKDTYKWHNFSVRVSRFLKLHFNIDFHLPVYFQTHKVDLSGTTRCPHKIPRIYDCWDCEYSMGLRSCGSEERQNLIQEGRYEETRPPEGDISLMHVCKFFKKMEYLSYDEDTGEVKYE